MKNKTLITIGLILFLTAALVIKNWNCSSVPELQGWYEPADEINLKGRDVSLSMVKKENKWYINEQAYPGDAELIESIERKARDFKLLDLVSDKGYYEKYDLTDEKGISVVIKGNGKILRKILVGKSASANNHSYLKVDDRKEIYLASGIMKTDFIRPVGDLRNKAIFNVKNSDIKAFSINYGGKNFEFLLNLSNSETDKNNVKNSDKNNGKDNKKIESKWICRGYEKVNFNDSSINAILALFSPLKAAEFQENEENKNMGKSLCRITITTADKKIELVIYNKKDKDMSYASSSESKYLFTLGSWQTEKLQRYYHV